MDIHQLFLAAIDPDSRAFVKELNQWLISQGMHPRDPGYRITFRRYDGYTFIRETRKGDPVYRKIARLKDTEDGAVPFSPAGLSKPDRKELRNTLYNYAHTWTMVDIKDFLNTQQ